MQATPGLVLPVERTTGLGCIPEGRTVSYECTVIDPSGASAGRLTVWEGSVIPVKCPSAASNQIMLSHAAFVTQQQQQPTVQCSALTATIIRANNTEYTSQLNFTATANLNEATLFCTVTGVDQAIFNDTIVVGGMLNVVIIFFSPTVI